MTKKKIRAYWCLLLTVVMAVTVALSVGDAWAGYVNVAVWNTTISTSSGSLSNCLVSGGKQIILLEALPMAGRTVTFTLNSGSTVTDTLTWTVDKAEYLDVKITVQGQETEEIEETEETVESAESQEPAEAAAAEVSQDTETTATGESTPAETDPEETGSEESDPEETDPEESEETTVQPRSITVEVPWNETVVLEMDMTLTEKALTTVHDEITVDILVCWGTRLGGTFRVTIPAVKEEDLPPVVTPEDDTSTDPTESTDPEDPESTDNENTDGDNTDTGEVDPDTTGGENSDENSGDNTGENTEESTGDDTEENNDENSGSNAEEHTDENAVGDGESEQDPEEPTETAGETVQSLGVSVVMLSEYTETQEEPTEVTETTEPTEPAESTGSQEGSEETGDTGTVDKPWMHTLSHFVPGEYLPVSITPPEGADQVTMMLGSMEGEELNVMVFPAFTRYSMDGETWYLLYDGGPINLTFPQTQEDSEGAQNMMLLDLSRISSTDVLLVAWAHGGSEIISELTAGSARFGTGLDGKAVGVLDSYNRNLYVTLPPSWAECDMEYTVELMHMDNNTGAVVYTQVKPDPAMLDAMRIRTGGLHHLAFTLGDYALAGTYRVTMKWSYEGTYFAQTQVTFFINYSVYSQSE